MSMSLDRRLQVLIDEDRERRLTDEARRRGVSVATIVREALDLALPVSAEDRRMAAQRLLGAAPMEVGSVADLKAELDAARRDLG
jgi:hypothetical protein